MLLLGSISSLSLTVHKLFGLALLVLAVVIAVISIMSRNDVPILENGLVFKRLAGPLVGVIAVTGIYRLIAEHIPFFQAWLIGAILLIVGYMGTLDGTWVPKAREQLARHAAGGGEDGEPPEPDSKAGDVLSGVAVSMIIMVIAAVYLMEHQPG